MKSIEPIMYLVSVKMVGGEKIEALSDDIERIMSITKDAKRLYFFGWDQKSEFDSMTKSLFSINLDQCLFYTFREFPNDYKNGQSSIQVT